MDADLDAIKRIKTLDDVYDFQDEVVKVATSSWSVVGEPHFAILPYNQKDELHGVSKTYVNGRLFQERVYVNNVNTSFVYYGLNEEINTIQLWDPLNGTLFKCSLETF